jgi:hypothetical protein
MKMRTHDGQEVVFIDHCPNRKLELIDQLVPGTIDCFRTVYYCRQCGYWEYADGETDAVKFVRH